MSYCFSAADWGEESGDQRYNIISGQVSMVYLLNCDYRFCDSRKSDKCFLVFAKFAKVMNVLSVLRIMQKWHAKTREGPVFMQLKCMSLLLDGW